MKEAGALRKHWRQQGFAVAVLGIGVLYVTLALSPSSYAVLFDILGVERAGLIAGEPRPIRADEWGRWTPFMQIARNNGFARINETSIYREDLRNVEGLPLRDWGLAFKPYFWPFFLVDPARAFSFYHAFWIVACLIGYERLFRVLGLTSLQAALASLTLFFTSFFQTWWTTYGPVVAGFPWLVLALLAPLPAALRAGAAAYVTVAWMLASLYPPIQVTCAFVAGVAVLAWRRDALALGRLVPFAAGVAVGGLLAFLYYQDAFAAMAETVYPGLRREGGGGVPFAQWLSHIAPSFVIRGEEGFVNENVCEAATVGSFLPLLLAFFVDWRDLGRRLLAQGEQARGLRLELGVLLAGVAATSLWLLAPVPAALGVPLLWHVVPGKRMWFAAGLLILLLCLGILRHARLRITAPRGGGVLVVAVGMSSIAGRVFAEASAWDAATAALVVAVVALVAVRERLGAARSAAVLACAALANLVAFAGFNPLQSAKPIFHLPEIPARASLDRLAERHERGWLVLHGSDGAWPNALGYRSATHILFAPRLAWFRPLFPGLPEEEFQYFFNRSMYPILSGRMSPSLLGDATLEVPIEVFDPPRIPVELGGAVPDGVQRGGRIDNRWAYVEEGAIHFFVGGWAPMDGSDPASRLRVLTRLLLAETTAYPSMRGDVARAEEDPRLALSGFEIRMTLATRAGAFQRPLAALLQEPLCIVSESPGYGSFWLRGGSVRDACPSP
jgi:hypothetical protein